MARRAASDSIAGKVEAAQRAANMPTEPPEGLRRLMKAERAAWDQYIPSRTEWKESELRTLHRLVMNETELAAIQQQRAILSTPIVENGNGGLSLNPIYIAIQKLEESIRSDLKMLGLNIPAHMEAKKPASPTGNAPTGAGRGKKAPVSLLK